MLPRPVRRSSNKSLRLVVLGVVCATLIYTCRWTFTVKGSWDGQLGDLKNLPAGLGPKSVGGVAFDWEWGSIKLVDGRLIVGYADGPISVNLDDLNFWQANITKNDTKLHLKGRGLDSIEWEISKNASVEGVGAVDVSVRSGRTIAIALKPDMPQFKGFDIEAVATSHGDDVQRSFKVGQHIVPGYDEADGAKDNHGCGDWSVLLDEHADALVKSNTYSVTLRKNLSSIFKPMAHAVIGADDDGVFGSLSGTRVISEGFTSTYQVSARGLGKESAPMLTYTVNVAHQSGKITVSRSSGEPSTAAMESAMSSGPVKVSGKLSTVLHKKSGPPSFNFTLSRDLADILPSGAEVVIGLDRPSLDGVYGKVAAKVRAGQGTLEYASVGRAHNMEHSIKVSNQLGYAKLMKAGDTSPRVQVGYKFEA